MVILKFIFSCELAWQAHLKRNPNPNQMTQGSIKHLLYKVIMTRTKRHKPKKKNKKRKKKKNTIRWPGETCSPQSSPEPPFNSHARYSLSFHWVDGGTFAADSQSVIQLWTCIRSHGIWYVCTRALY